MLTIDADGSVVVDDSDLRRKLQKYAGQWRVVGTSQDLLFFVRKGSRESESAFALMRGEVRREGWLVELINFIASARLTGELVVVADDIQRELFFDRGTLKMASSPSKRYLLGEFLVSEGVIGRSQLTQALREKGPGKRLGQVLMESGVLSGPDMYHLLNRKITRIFHDTIVLGHGEYYFISDIDLAKLPTFVHLDTHALIIEGAQRIDEIVYSQSTVPRRRPESQGAEAGGGVGDLAQRVLDCVNGTRTVSTIAGMLGVTSEETTGVVRALEQAGYVDTVSVDEAEEAAVRLIVQSYNEALRVTYEAVMGVVEPGELTRLGREFVASRSHSSTALRTVVIADDGSIEIESVRLASRSSERSGRAKLAVMILTQYVSFVLFQASSQLPISLQEQLLSRVSKVLEHVLYAHM